MLISWFLSEKFPWRAQFYLNEIRTISSSLGVRFQHVPHWANGFVDSLEKQGVNKSVDLVAVLL